MGRSDIENIELQEIIERLRQDGFAKLMDCLEDEALYTRADGGRLNLSALARKLKLGGVATRKRLVKLQEAARRLCGDE